MSRFYFHTVKDGGQHALTVRMRTYIYLASISRFAALQFKMWMEEEILNCEQ